MCPGSYFRTEDSLYSENDPRAPAPGRPRSLPGWPPSPYPFAVGETLRYDAKLGYFPVGTATVSVSRRAQERGVDAYVFTLAGQGGPPGWRVRYDLTSWVDSRRFNSLRFHRQLVAGRESRGARICHRARLQPLPGGRRARRLGYPSDPLDELAFLYFLRTAPLQLGRSYTCSAISGPATIRSRWWSPAANRWPCRTENATCLPVAVTSRGDHAGLAHRRRPPAAGAAGAPAAVWGVALSLVAKVAGSGAVKHSTAPYLDPPDSYRSPICSPAGCTAAPRSAWPPGIARSGARPGPP